MVGCRLHRFVTCALLAFSLTGCGGGGGGAGAEGSQPLVTISGIANGHPISGGSVVLQALNGAPLATTTGIAADGSFSVTVEKSRIQGGYRLVVSGAQLDGQLLAATLKASYRAQDDPTSANVTPLTTLVSMLAGVNASQGPLDARDAVIQQLADMGVVGRSEWSSTDPGGVSFRHSGKLSPPTDLTR